MYRQLIIIAALLAPFSAPSAAAEVPYIDVVGPSKFKYIGIIPRDCKAVLDNNETHAKMKTPAGFKVSPQEALATAMKAVDLSCSDEATRIIAAGEKRYTVSSMNLLPSGSIAAAWVLIDGMSGDVIKTRTQRIDAHYFASGVSAAQPEGKR